MDISAIITTTPDALAEDIAMRVKARRLERDLTQKAFAARAGIGYDAYRRFEYTGETTLHNLIRCAIVLDDMDGFEMLFRARRYASLDALIDSKNAKPKKRGRRNE